MQSSSKITDRRDEEKKPRSHNRYTATNRKANDCCFQRSARKRSRCETAAGPAARTEARLCLGRRRDCGPHSHSIISASVFTRD